MDEEISLQRRKLGFESPVRGVAKNGVANEISRGTKLGKALSKIGHQDRTAVWSLAKGYDVMEGGYGYHVVINRSALIASKDIKSMGSSWK